MVQRSLGELEMALQGKIIELAKDRYGFEYLDPHYSEPTIIRQVWPIVALSTRGMTYCRIEEAIGKPASLTDGRVSCYLGQGNYVGGALPELGATKSIIMEETPAPRPKCRSELRWQNGRWQKYSKRQGWIAA
jgi:hypothetical protein